MNTEPLGPSSPEMTSTFEFAQDQNDRGKRPLVLAFAYSLMPNGGSGLYNRILAQTILNDWAGKPAWIGVQWEIKDALADPLLSQALAKEKKLGAGSLLRRLGFPETSPRQLGQEVHTAPPFEPIRARTNEGKALDWKAFRELLQNSLAAKGDPAVAELAEALAGLAGRAGYYGSGAAVLWAALSSSEQVAVFLNRLIATERDFHKRFWPGAGNSGAILELHGRQREGFGPVGFEQRRLPAAGDSLGEYQALRVNRLIVDAICPERSILPQPGYLSTRGVLQYLFDKMQKPTDFDRVFIYGSPVHSGRCKRQFIEFAWSVGWFVDPAQVITIYRSDDMGPCGWVWDGDSAQVWCRSRAAWDAYEENDARLR